MSSITPNTITTNRINRINRIQPGSIQDLRQYWENETKQITPEMLNIFIQRGDYITDLINLDRVDEYASIIKEKWRELTFLIKMIK